VAAREQGEVRDGVELKHLDGELFDGAGVTKRDLVDYLDAVAPMILPELRDRPLTVLRVRPGQQPFMQKNLPAYAPAWIPTMTVWAQASHRDVRYPLCHERRTLLWFAGQRAVEFHPTVLEFADDGQPVVTHLVLDLDPPEGAAFADVVAAARLVHRALADTGLEGAVKTSGSKGMHVLVPLAGGVRIDDSMAATRALAARAEAFDPSIATTAFILQDRHGKVYVDPTRAGGASLACAYSPRARPGVPVSFPVPWDRLGDVSPSDFTVLTAPALLSTSDPWRDLLPAPQPLPPGLVEEGHRIPVPRVAAMHEGKRRARARRE
jgi:bifunctional non-homologous end joining protein LigD